MNPQEDSPVTGSEFEAFVRNPLSVDESVRRRCEQLLESDPIAANLACGMDRVFWQELRADSQQHWRERPRPSPNVFEPPAADASAPVQPSQGLSSESTGRNVHHSRHSVRAILLTTALLVLPPLLVAASAFLLGDAGLGINSWAMQLNHRLEQAAGAIAVLGFFCWIVGRQLGWLNQPALSGVGSVAALAGTMLVAQATVTNHATEQQKRLAKLFQSETWISYDSAYYWPHDLEQEVHHPAQEPTDDEIRSELKILRDAGFTGLYLHEFRAGQRNVPRIAREEGFRGVVVAIRVKDASRLDEPATQEQVDNVVSASRFIDAICFGEMTAREVDLDGLKQQLAELRRRSNKPVTTSFLDDEYFGKRGDPLRELADFSVRGLHHDWKSQPGVDAALLRAEKALESFHDDNLPTLLTYVGSPSGGADEWTEATQHKFFAGVRRLRKPLGTNVVYFTSFERPWARKLSEAKGANLFEGYFGLFTVEGGAGDRAIRIEPKKCVELFNPTK